MYSPNTDSYVLTEAESYSASKTSTPIPISYTDLFLVYTVILIANIWSFLLTVRIILIWDMPSWFVWFAGHPSSFWCGKRKSASTVSTLHLSLSPSTLIVSIQRLVHWKWYPPHHRARGKFPVSLLDPSGQRNIQTHICPRSTRPEFGRAAQSSAGRVRVHLRCSGN